MENTLRELLDKIYELVGLVHLSLKREEATDDFKRLIVKKGFEVSGLCQELENKKNLSEQNNDNIIISSTEIIDIDSTEKFNSSSGFRLLDLEEYSIDEENENSSEDFSKDSEFEIISPSNSSKKGKLVFSLNDRFRFRKELFNNSDIDFNNTLALVASMEDYVEAEDYFLNEEGFDRDQPVVKEFLEIIKRYF